jgi:hypothetical protein
LPIDLLTFAKSLDVEVRAGISVPEEFVPTRNTNLEDHVPLRAG